MDLGHHSRLGQVEHVRVAPDVSPMIAKAFAAVLLLRELAAVDEHTVRAVEHEDALSEEFLEL